MTEYKINTFFSNLGTRNEVRMRVVEVFAKEIHGSGQGYFETRYTYYVEKLNDNNKIYLRRPANLHNGFDFLVYVGEYDFNINNKKKKLY